ncbi:hypothetical protein EJ110_NYTH08292 [Nymphaea thermarum]|nr:hypothetical protein EJ110_NYTH08292 [Nymphaea thermarum]
MLFKSKIKWAALIGFALSIFSLLVHLLLAKYSSGNLFHYQFSIQKVMGHYENLGVLAAICKPTSQVSSWKKCMHQLLHLWARVVAGGRDSELEDCPMTSVDWIGDEPMVVFPAEAYQKMEELYRFAAVAGFFGGRSNNDMDYGYVFQALRKLWACVSCPEFSVIGNERFLVRVNSEEELTEVLRHSKWVVGGRFLISSRWKAGSELRLDEEELVPLWIQLPDLPGRSLDLHGCAQKSLSALDRWPKSSLKSGSPRCYFRKCSMSLRLDVVVRVVLPCTMRMLVKIRETLKAKLQRTRLGVRSWWLRKPKEVSKEVNLVEGSFMLTDLQRLATNLKRLKGEESNLFNIWKLVRLALTETRLQTLGSGWMERRVVIMSIRSTIKAG